MPPFSCENPFESNRLNGAADFRPDWDSPSAGRNVTDALSRDIAAARDRPAPDTTRKIHLILGAPGYGKTHLFGRVRSEQGDRVQFIFIPAPPDASRATEYVCWRVVETLFHPNGAGIAPIRSLLARLLRPSFAAYFDQLPDGLRARCSAVRHRLEADPAAVLDVMSPVTTILPYQALAESVQQAVPGLKRDVVRALVLGLSPAAEDARAWLRGEADQLPDGRARALKLGEHSPEPLDVVQAVAAILGRVAIPLVLSLDQLDELYLKSAEGFQELSTQAMKWLQEVPGLVLVLACVEARWREITANAGLAAFVDRVMSHVLDPLTSAQARELVNNRMQSWEGFDPARGPGWPFDPASVERFVEKQPVSPRGLIDRCREEFDKWQAGPKGERISLSDVGKPPPIRELFLREWEGQLAACRQSLKSPLDYKDDELWEGVEEALLVARTGQHVPAGVTFERMQLQALAKAPSDPRYSAELHLAAGSSHVPVVIAVSKKDSGTAFSHWVTALEGALGGSVAGAVVVRPRGELTVGKNSQGYKKYQQLIQGGSLRPFPLDEHKESFEQLVCLRQLVRDAKGDNLILGGMPVKVDECRKLVAETRVLADLKLFEFLFQGWPAVEQARAAPAKAPAASQPPAPPAAPPRQPVAPSPMPVPAAVAAPPKPPAPPPAPSWADEMLKKVADKLRARGQPVRPIGYELGPTFVRLKVEPRDDTDFAKVKKQVDNLKMQLGIEQRPFIAAQAGFISIDVQRPDRQVVALPGLLPSRPADLAGQPAFPVGVDVAGRPHWLNLADTATCHLLLGGTTGSGKSQLLKAMLGALAGHLGPDQIQFLLIDPKRVTFTLSGASPYLGGPVVYDAGEALPLLERCCHEMEDRYARLESLGREDVKELSGADAVPRWVIVFDEFADLMADRSTKKDLESLLKRLGAKARAAGIHLVLGTQRPEASVVTPLLRSNLPGRIALQVASEKDSKIILDEPDAAHLLDKGDLFWRRGGALHRLQSPLVTRQELEGYLRLH